MNSGERKDHTGWALGMVNTLPVPCTWGKACDPAQDTQERPKGQRNSDIHDQRGVILKSQRRLILGYRNFHVTGNSSKAGFYPNMQLSSSPPPTCLFPVCKSHSARGATLDGRQKMSHMKWFQGLAVHSWTSHKDGATVEMSLSTNSLLKLCSLILVRQLQAK